uniref:Uncharacterized protein n=1 Tax=Trichogramma kaykai TaxID=54128 RepID=A0ABD2W3H7_9HYME
MYGDTVAWRSHKQSCIALSTCMAEYRALSDVCQEIISLDKATRDITGENNYPVTVWCDNISAGKCTEMDGSNKLKCFDDDVEEIKQKLRDRENRGLKSKISVTHGDFIKCCVNEGKIKVKWINTVENEADIFTKPLPPQSHNYLRDKIFRVNGGI